MSRSVQARHAVLAFSVDLNVPWTGRKNLTSYSVSQETMSSWSDAASEQIRMWGTWSASAVDVSPWAWTIKRASSPAQSTARSNSSRSNSLSQGTCTWAGRCYRIVRLRHLWRRRPIKMTLVPHRFKSISRCWSRACQGGAVLYGVGAAPPRQRLSSFLVWSNHLTHLMIWARWGVLWASRLRMTARHRRCQSSNKIIKINKT